MTAEAQAAAHVPLASVTDVDAPRIIRLKSGGKKKPHRVPLFYIDDKMFTIEAKAKPNDSLRYLDIMRRQGQEAAIGFMMETLVGEAGWQALMDYDELTEDDLEQIIRAAQKIMTGAMEAPKETA